ncbi:MAG: hypothetical protein ACKOFI_10800, partial [Phycisphaerales bacterium]
PRRPRRLRIFGIASKVGEAIEVEKKVEVLAKYRGLENKTVAVLVNAERGVLYEYPTVVPNVAGNVAAGIRKHVSGAQVLDWRESLAWAYRTPSWTTLPLGQVAEELGVDRVVLVDIFEFRLHPPGNRWIWDGMAGASIGIIERDSLDPDAFVEEYSVAVKFPDVADLSRESAQERAGGERGDGGSNVHGSTRGRSARRAWRRASRPPCSPRPGGRAPRRPPARGA